jgi:hypothetical protein
MSIRLLILGQYNAAETLLPTINVTLSTTLNDVFLGTSVALSKNSTVGNMFLAAGFPGYNSGGFYGGFFKYYSTNSNFVETNRYLQYGATASGFTASSKLGSTSVIGADGLIWSSSDYAYSGNAGVSLARTLISGVTSPVSVVPSTATGATYYGYSQAMSQDSQYLAIGAIKYAAGAGGGGVYLMKANSIVTNAITAYNQQTVIQPAGLSSSDEFGASVALSQDGTTLAVGAPSRTGGGRVYIYIRSGNAWSQQASFIGSDTTGTDKFGYSVALTSDGSTLVVGAIQHNSNAGAAYIFKRTGVAWAQQSKLVSPNSSPGLIGNFGCSVDVNSDASKVIVGASGENYTYNGFGYANRGVAYIFSGTGTNKILSATLLPDALQGGGVFFGTSVSINNAGTIAAVGAPFADYGAYSNNGMVGLYKI